MARLHFNLKVRQPNAHWRFRSRMLVKLARSKTGEVLSWCPSCHVQFTEMTLPTVEKTRGAKPFDMTPFTLFLRRHVDRMRPLLRERVPMRIALHRHPCVHGVVEAAEEILRAVPGIQVVDLHQPAVGLQANNLRVLPQYAACCRSRSFWRLKQPASTARTIHDDRNGRPRPAYPGGV